MLSAIYGRKIVQGNFVLGGLYGNPECLLPEFPNIGAIKINRDTRRHIFEIFNLLTINWIYLPDDDTQNKIIDFFSQYYDYTYVEYIKEIFKYHKRCFAYDLTDTETRHRNIDVNQSKQTKTHIMILGIILKKIIKYLLPYGFVRLIQKCKQ
jgi:hypothetical protein